MKITIISLAFLISITASAEESAMSLPSMETSQIKMTELKSDVQPRVTAWKFHLGQSAAVYNSRSYSQSKTEGNGLTLGAAYQWTDLFSAGASFTRLRNETLNDFGDYSYKYSSTSNLITAYAEFTPFQYNYKQLDLNGSILAGAIATTNNSLPFYGAALSISLNKQIGISVDTKVSVVDSTHDSDTDVIQSMNQISLIGYY